MIIIFIKFINQSNDGLNQDFFPIIEFNIPLNLQKYISLFSLLKINVKIIYDATEVPETSIWLETSDRPKISKLIIKRSSQ